MSEPKTFTSYEFGFANGQVVAFTIEHGKDLMSYVGENAYATIHHDGDSTESIELLRPWCYMRAIERTEKPEEKPIGE